MANTFLEKLIKNLKINNNNNNNKIKKLYLKVHFYL